jgi:hypothetical protein
LVKNVFLGDNAFTGPLGLCEFEESRNQIKSLVSTFYISIDSKNVSVNNSFALSDGVDFFSTIY